MSSGDVAAPVESPGRAFGAYGRVVRKRFFTVASGMILMPAVCDAFSGGSMSGFITGPPTTESSALAAPAESTTPASGTADDLHRLLVEYVGDENGGVSVLSIRDGTTITAVAGVANADGDPIAADTPFRVGSISKTFVATIVLQLVDEGRVDLDEPLSTYLPNTPIGGDVPLRMLLNHRSGLRNYTDRSAFVTDVFEDRSRVFTPDQILAWVEGAATDEPDQRFAYSNTNYILLGQLVERVTDTDLDTALRERISEPLGLEATRFAATATANPDDLAAPWSPAVFHGDPDAAYDSIASSAWAAGSLTSTTGELATFLDALFAGELISQDSLDEMTATGPERYGLGLEAFDMPSGERFYGHGGAIDGYTSVMGFNPDTGDTLVILTNNDAVIAGRLAEHVIETWWSDQSATATTAA